MIQDLFNIGKFSLDGETYIPGCPAGDREWPIETENNLFEGGIAMKYLKRGRRT